MAEISSLELAVKVKNKQT